MTDQKQIEITPRGTRGSRIPWGLINYLQPLMKGQITRYRKNAGPEPPKLSGNPLVLLSTVGAKSGKERTHPLGGFSQGNDVWVVIASKGGAATHPSWFINLAKNPDKVWLEVGNRKFHVRPEVLKGPEREDVYAKCAAIVPGYAKYRQITDREIPVIRLTPITNPPG
jgi:deazaflavin-dependent oxidoreductase (nitroreductase family)